jgi:predicted nuclease of predicted toxin-antitoxin system
MKPQLFLLDQMFDRKVRDTLRELGYDIVAVSEIGMATADDAEIMECASVNGRTVITLDDHFGDWTVLPLSRHPGVIRLKVNPTTTENTLKLLLPFLKNHQDKDFSNSLVIVADAGCKTGRNPAPARIRIG